MLLANETPGRLQRSVVLGTLVDLPTRRDAQVRLEDELRGDQPRTDDGADPKLVAALRARNIEEMVV